MKVLYLIGNGFDRNLGLKTAYAQFYPVYLSEASPNKNVVKFKEFLVECQKKENPELWSNLELLLGESSVIFDSASDYKKAIIDVNNSLRRYIEDQNSKGLADKAVQTAFMQDVLDPLQYLMPREQKNFRSYLAQMDKSWDISFVSFNYTDCLERLLGLSNGAQIGKNCSGGTSTLSRIYHIHGTCDKTILVGLDNASQIKNPKFRTDASLLRCLVKPFANAQNGEVVDDECRILFQTADLVVGFGLSYGATDSCWWKILSDILVYNSKRMIVFDHNEDSTLDLVHNSFAIGDLKEIVGKRVLGANNEGVRLSHILYSVNSNMFSGLRNFTNQ